MFKDKKICVVVPAYNEERFIRKTIVSIPEYVDKIIVVDDASSDGTPQVLDRLGKEFSKLIVLRNNTNKGVGGAIITGYKRSLAEGIDISVVMAGDAQMNPDNLPALLDPIVKEDADYVKGNRLLKNDVKKLMPGFRYIGNSILTILTKIASGNWHIMDPQCGYTAISKNTLEKINLDRIYGRYGYVNDFLIDMNIQNIRVKDVPVDPVYRDEKSKINIFTYIPNVSMILLKGFSRRLIEKYVIRDFHPLVLFYFVGILSSIAGSFLSLVVIHHRIFIGAISIPTVILCTLLMITGLQSIFFAMLFDMEYQK